ncbi:MAG: penicillin-binding protein 2, partial [Bacteroidales bacterium]|nr:penicillin-binding protein 2 [Bacteroidales bacterium]
MKKNLANRKYFIITLFLSTGIIFLMRLFFLQVVDDSYLLSAENNVLRQVIQYPARGLIYDRNDILLVYDEAAYDLMVIPSQVKDIDTSELCDLIGIDIETYKKKFGKARKHSIYKPSVFQEQISKVNYGYLEEKLYKFNGFYVQSRSLREYPIPIAAHTLGYIGEVDKREIKADKYYKQGDYIGKSGIEKAYENELRGKKGIKIIMVDVFNREQGSYKNGKYDSVAVAGKNLYLTLDSDLQIYGEKLMQNKRGSIVAIEPSTGEILALISSPAYDPNLLIGRIRSENFIKLSNDTLKPLFNRASMATYPPGSTFKVVNALIGLQERVLFP